MNREQLEESAKQYGLVNFNPDDAEAAKRGFMAGALWRINSIWHTLPKDLPQKENTLILLELIFEGRLVYLPVEWVNDGEEAPSQATRWAYIDDLLPERKEETK